MLMNKKDKGFDFGSFALLIVVVLLTSSLVSAILYNVSFFKELWNDNSGGFIFFPLPIFSSIVIIFFIGIIWVLFFVISSRIKMARANTDNIEAFNRKTLSIILTVVVILDILVFAPDIIAFFKQRFGSLSKPGLLCVESNKVCSESFFAYKDKIYYLHIDDDDFNKREFYVADINGNNSKLLSSSLGDPHFDFVYNDEAYYHNGSQNENWKINLNDGKITKVNASFVPIPSTLNNGTIKTQGLRTGSHESGISLLDLNNGTEKIVYKAKYVEDSNYFYNVNENVFYKVENGGYEGGYILLNLTKNDELVDTFKLENGNEGYSSSIRLLYASSNEVYFTYGKTTFKKKADTDLVLGHSKISGIEARIDSNDSNNSYYLLEHGVYIFNKETFELDKLFNDSKIVSSMNIDSMYVTDSNIYLSYGTGLYIYNKASKELVNKTDLIGHFIDYENYVIYLFSVADKNFKVEILKD